MSQCATLGLLRHRRETYLRPGLCSGAFRLPARFRQTSPRMRSHPTRARCGRRTSTGVRCLRVLRHTSRAARSPALQRARCRQRWSGLAPAAGRGCAVRFRCAPLYVRAVTAVSPHSLPDCNAIRCGYAVSHSCSAPVATPCRYGARRRCSVPGCCWRAYAAASWRPHSPRCCGCAHHERWKPRAHIPPRRANRLALRSVAPQLRASKMLASLRRWLRWCWHSRRASSPRIDPACWRRWPERCCRRARVPTRSWPARCSASPANTRPSSWALSASTCVSSCCCAGTSEPRRPAWR